MSFCTALHSPMFESCGLLSQVTIAKPSGMLTLGFEVNLGEATGVCFFPLFWPGQTSVQLLLARMPMFP